MSSDFESAPNLHQDFRDVDGRAFPPSKHELDAANWEPTEEPALPKIAEQHPTLDLTPGGYLEQDVHTHLDDRARAALRAATQQRVDPRDDLRDFGNQWSVAASRMNERLNDRMRTQWRRAESWDDVIKGHESDQSQDHERELDFSDDRDR